MNVASLMTRDPIAVAPHVSADRAMHVMDTAGVRHLPVVDGGRLTGVVSDRDLLIATGWLPTSVGGSHPPKQVGELQSSPATVISSDDSAVTAALEMSTRGIFCLPVVDDGVLVGIVTEIDLLSAFSREVWRSNRRGDDPATAQLMSRDIKTAERNTSLIEALETCRQADIRHLPVLEGERLVGIVSDHDLRRAIGKGLRAESPVDAVQSASVVSIRATDEISHAADLMVDNRIGALPVVDGQEHRLVGILSAIDVLDHCTSTLRGGVETGGTAGNPSAGTNGG